MLDPGEPFCNIPFPRNSRFVGREEQLDQLQHEILARRKAAKVAITGLGGAGKTQVALELAYRIREATPDCLVIWIPAISMEGLEQAYTNVVRKLQIPGSNNAQADSKVLLQQYLGQRSTGRWLLIFDNADDASMWASENSGQRRLIDYLPRSDHGQIVFTTRDRKAAVKLAHQNVVRIAEADEGLAMQLLRSYLIQEELVDDYSCAMDMLTELAFLPLAVVQAAAYINENGIGLTDYLNLLKEQEQDVVELLSEDFEDEGRYEETQNPVATTWHISFERIQTRDSLAAEYLSFMACMEPTNVPQSLLPPGPSKKRETDAIGLLTAYSFVSWNSTTSMMNTHRLVHLAMRSWLRIGDNNLTKWNARAVQRLAEVLPFGDHETRSSWRLYLAHTRRVLEDKLDGESLETRAELLYKFAMCLDADGRYKEAEQSYSQAIEIMKEALGAEHPNTLRTLHNLASTFWNQGRWTEAEELQIRVLETMKEVLGEEHPVTLSSLHNLAVMFSAQRRWTEAEELQIRVLEICLRVLGEEHPATLTSKANLANTYWFQERFTEAEELQVNQLETCSRVLGEEHPVTLSSLHNLAVTFSAQRRWTEAEELQIRVLGIRSRVLEEEHPDTLTSMETLSNTYRSQERFTEAEELGTKVLEIRSSLLGEEHPATLTSKANLANTYYSQERFTEAEELEVKVLGICSRVLGEEHPDTLTSMNNLAFDWKSLGREEQAISLLEKCARLRRSVLGPEHSRTRASSDVLSDWQAEGLNA